MIIPVKCFTCGKVLADKWTFYVTACKKMQEDRARERERDAEGGNGGGTHEQQHDDIDRSKVFETLQLDRICCRRHMLGHVDMIDII